MIRPLVGMLFSIPTERLPKSNRRVVTSVGIFKGNQRPDQFDEKNEPNYKGDANGIRLEIKSGGSFRQIL